MNKRFISCKLPSFWSEKKKKDKKRRKTAKTAKKNILTAVRCAQHPKACQKYTTTG